MQSALRRLDALFGTALEDLELGVDPVPDIPQDLLLKEGVEDEVGVLERSKRQSTFELGVELEEEDVGELENLRQEIQ